MCKNYGCIGHCMSFSKREVGAGVTIVEDCAIVPLTTSPASRCHKGPVENRLEMSIRILNVPCERLSQLPWHLLQAFFKPFEALAVRPR